MPRPRSGRATKRPTRPVLLKGQSAWWAVLSGTTVPSVQRLPVIAVPVRWGGAHRRHARGDPYVAIEGVRTRRVGRVGVWSPGASIRRRFTQTTKILFRRRTPV